MKKFISTFLLLSLGSWAAGQSEKITSISFETSTRGYHKTILIRADSVFIREQTQTGKNVKRKTQPAEWASLLKSVAGYNLSDLIQLPAPSNNRARDAARTSVIYVKTDQKTYNSGFFDDQKPNPKLSALMKEISQMENTKP